MSARLHVAGAVLLAAAGFGLLAAETADAKPRPTSIPTSAVTNAPRANTVGPGDCSHNGLYTWDVRTQPFPRNIEVFLDGTRYVVDKSGVKNAGTPRAYAYYNLRAEPGAVAVPTPAHAPCVPEPTTPPTTSTPTTPTPTETSWPTPSAPPATSTTLPTLSPSPSRTSSTSGPSGPISSTASVLPSSASSTSGSGRPSRSATSSTSSATSPELAYTGLTAQAWKTIVTAFVLLSLGWIAVSWRRRGERR